VVGLRSVLTWEQRLTAGVVVAGERDAPIGADHNPRLGDLTAFPEGAVHVRESDRLGRGQGGDKLSVADQSRGSRWLNGETAGRREHFALCEDVGEQDAALHVADASLLPGERGQPQGEREDKGKARSEDGDCQRIKLKLTPVISGAHVTSSKLRQTGDRKIIEKGDVPPDHQMYC